jgi:hypothetical protein
VPVAPVDPGTSTRSAEADLTAPPVTLIERVTSLEQQVRDLRAELAARALDRLTWTDRRALAHAVPALICLAETMQEAP